MDTNKYINLYIYFYINMYVFYYNVWLHRYLFDWNLDIYPEAPWVFNLLINGIYIITIYFGLYFLRGC